MEEAVVFATEQHDGGLAADAQGVDVALFAVSAFEERDRVAHELRDVAEDRQGSRYQWRAQIRHAEILSQH